MSEVTNRVSVSNEELAQMIARGFEGVDKRFESMDKRFESMDKRFESMESRMATKKDLEEFATKKAQDRLEMKVDEMGDEIKLLDVSLTNVHTDIRVIIAKDRKLEKRVRKLEDHVGFTKTA